MITFHPARTHPSPIKSSRWKYNNKTIGQKEGEQKG